MRLLQILSDRMWNGRLGPIQYGGRAAVRPAARSAMSRPKRGLFLGLPRARGSPGAPQTPRHFLAYKDFVWAGLAGPGTGPRARLIWPGLGPFSDFQPAVWAPTIGQWRFGGRLFIFGRLCVGPFDRGSIQGLFHINIIIQLDTLFNRLNSIC